VLFFIVAGFYMSIIINGKYAKLPASAFYVSRAPRIYPAYWIVLVLAFLLRDYWVDTAALKSPLAASIDMRPGMIFANLTTIGLDSRHAVVTPAWTLAIELQFYLVAPFIVRRHLGIAPSGATLTSFIGPLQTLNVELDHFQHGFRNSLGPLPIGILHHLAEYRGHDLPGESVTIFQPPTPLDVSALRQRHPEPVNFGLIVALHHQRYGMIKGIDWSGADRHERLPHQRELDHVYRTGRAARTLRR
jgi:Acyltransferase family